MQPITIKQGSFEAQLYDVDNLMELPLANLRKLWKIMLDTEDENREAIAAIREWLPSNITNAHAAIHTAQDRYKQAARDAETIRREVAAFGSMVTKEQKAMLKAANSRLKSTEQRLKAARDRHDRANKLLSIFNEMAKS